MKKLFLSVFIIVLSMGGVQPVWATHDLAALEKKIQQQKKASPVIQNKSKPFKTTPTPPKKLAPKVSPNPSSKKGVQAPKNSPKKSTTGVKKSSPASPIKVNLKKVPVTPEKTALSTKKELAGEVVEIKTKPVTQTQDQKKEDAKTLERQQQQQKQQDDLKKQQEEITRATKQAILSATIERAELLKAQADALAPKLQDNPNIPDYLENLRKKNGIKDLQEQFNKLQGQVDAIEKDIRSLSQNKDTVDLSKTFALQKTKFILLQQQEGLLQQIELKESYANQLYEFAKRDYDLNKKLHDSTMERYSQDQATIKQLKTELEQKPQQSIQLQDQVKVKST